MDFDQTEFEWYKLKHPYSTSRIYLAVEKISKRQAGVICCQTFPYRIGSEIKKTNLLVSGGTHPEFRRMGVFGRLSNVIVDHGSRIGVQHTVTFPNPYLRRSFTAFLKAGWHVPIEYQVPREKAFPKTLGRRYQNQAV